MKTDGLPFEEMAAPAARGIRRLLAPNPGLMTLSGTNTYLIGEREVAVIDPGPDLEAHLEAILTAIEFLGGKLGLVLVTHSHPDHLPGAVALSSRTGAPLAGYSGVRGATVGLVHGQRLTVDGLQIVAIHTPGHASDHMAYYIEGEGVLFTGDHILGEGTTVVSPPDGDMEQYLASLRLLLGLDLQLLLPGHGPPVADPRAKIHEYLEHRMMREDQVVHFLGQGRTTIDELVEAIYVDVPKALHPVARRTVQAHLEKLVREGRVQVFKTGGLSRYRLSAGS